MREPKRKRISVDAVFDIETEDWTTFVVGGLYYKDGAYSDFDWNREDDYVDALFAIEGNVWAHNGGRFDAKWFLDHAIKRDKRINVVAAGSRIVSIRIGDLRIYDSKALTMLSLEDFTEGQGVEKEELGLPCNCSERETVWKDKRGRTRHGCGGYCSIKRTMPKPLFKRLREYLEADCRSLYNGLAKLQEFADETDLDLGITVGSSAWANAKRWLELPSADLEAPEHNFARDGYYGGRVQLFRPRANKGFECDVNSMYPSRLAGFALPWGDWWRPFGGDARREYDGSRPGIYRATVNVPEMHIPPLPYRVKGKGRISYPTGRFQGTWALPELQYAETQGVKVEITEALVFETEQVVFKAWVDKLFALRYGAPGGKKGPVGTFLKFYLNSLTGKLGARPDVEEVEINPEEVRGCNCKTDECDGFCGRHIHINEEDDIYVVKRWRIHACAHVEWASYLTAQSRIEWHRQATSKKDGWDMIYGDTDSVFSVQQRTRNMGKELGQWDDAGPFADFRGWAPKLYTYRREGKRTVKGKGLRLPRDADKALALLTSGQKVGAEAVIGFWRGVREGEFFKKAPLFRLPRQGFGDRILEAGEQVTRAPTVDEVHAKDERDSANGFQSLSM